MASPNQPSAFGQQSIYQVTRQLKREQHTLYNCLASILADATFVKEIRLLYPDLPLFSNLRAGGWYAPNPDGTCYFKSTDGHQNNCNFSVTRLNWHVAELAAQKGGVVIVDATRKGKRFPDAMTKTIPIWAAVLNRAVARVRAYDAQKAQRRRTFALTNGDVISAVADTQTVISVRSDHPPTVCSQPTHKTATPGDPASCTSCSSEPIQQQQQQQPSQLVHTNGPDQQHFSACLQDQKGTQQTRHEGSTELSGCSATSTPINNHLVEAACTSNEDVTTAQARCVNGSSQVVQLLVDCMQHSVDLMSGMDGNGCCAPADRAVECPASPGLAAVLAPESGPACASLHSTAFVASQPTSLLAATFDAGPHAPATSSFIGSCLGPTCCTLHRSRSVHISPQPSLHEWLDEKDVLRRLSLMSDTRNAVRPSPRVSCPSSSGCITSKDARHTCAVRVPPARTATCAASAPAKSCLLASAEDDVTPASGGCAYALRMEDEYAFETLHRSPAAALNSNVPQPAAGMLTVATSTSTQVAPALDDIGPPAFLLSAAAGAGSLHEESLGEPTTPRLLVCSGSSFNSHSSSGKQLSPGSCSQVASSTSCHTQQEQGSSHDVVSAEFAFPSPLKLAASAESSVGAEAAGCLAASHLASSGSSCDSEPVRLPDMPVVVLNGTSHQPGDAASILDIWRGTDLEDVACLPGTTDFRPGVYHLPGNTKQQNPSLEDDEWLTAPVLCRQDQQPAPDSSTLEDDAGNSTVSSRTAVSWAAEVCLRSEQQLSGRLSVSDWLNDDDTVAACDALCAFALPVASCCSTSGSTHASDEAATSCGSWVSRSHGSGSVCSDDSRASSRQSSTTAGFSNAAPAGESASSASGCCLAALEASGPAATVNDWDTSLHLPLWVSNQEREMIEAKLDSWVERLLEIGADVRGLAAVLSKPLRPLWVSQSSLIWTNQVAHPSTLPFIPLLLVSASQPHAGERQAVKSAWLSLARGCNTGSPVQSLSPGYDNPLSTCSDDFSSDDEFAADAGLARSWTSSSSRSKCKRSKLTLSSDIPGSKQSCRLGKVARNKGIHKAELGSWSYLYVPGAGDDEESWAAGLTPALFWQYCDMLLRSGPNNVKQAVKQLLQLHRSASCGAVSASLAATAIRGFSAAPIPSHSSGRPLSPLGAASRTGAGCFSACVPAAYSDQHHPAPQGCVVTPQGARLHVVPAAPGAVWLGNTGLAVGNLEGASAADVWRAVDAVLCCGPGLIPVLQGEYQAMQLAAMRKPATPAIAVSSSAPTCGAWVSKQRQQLHECSSQCSPPERPVCSSFCTSTGSVHMLQAMPGSSSSSSGNEQHGLQVAHVEGAPARKPVCRSGMLSALLSKAGVSAKAWTGRNSSSAGSDAAASAAHHAFVIDATHPVGPSRSQGSSVSCSDCSSLCSSSYHSVCSDEALPMPGGMHNPGACSGPALPRLKWLPIQSAKKERSSLKSHMQEALEYVSAHLAEGHTVLLHDMEGHDNCVCMAVAVLSGCFQSPSAAEQAESGSSEPHFVAAWQSLIERQQQQGSAQQLQPPAPVSKQSVRQHLAVVSGCYPLARPTRAMLKQVFNFFEERRREEMT